MSDMSFKIKGESREMQKISKKMMIMVGAILVTGILLTTALRVTGGSSNRKLNEQLDLGAKYLSELDYEQAIVVFKAAIEIEPKSADAYLGLADAYVAIQDYKMAAEVLETGFTKTQDGKLEEKLIELQMFSEHIMEINMNEETELNEAAKVEKKLNDIIIKDSRNINLVVDGGLFWGHKFSSLTIEQVREIAADKNLIAADAKVEKESKASWAYVLGEPIKSFYVFLWGDTLDKPLEEGLRYQAGAGYETMYGPSYFEEENIPDIVKNRVEIGIAGIQFGDTLEEVLKKLGSEFAEEIVNLIAEWRKEYDWSNADIYSSAGPGGEVYAVRHDINYFMMIKDNSYPEQPMLRIFIWNKNHNESVSLFFFGETYILYGMRIR